MAPEVQTIVALRLAEELRECIENMDTLPPQEAAAGIRKTVLARCMLLRSLLPDSVQRNLRAQLIEALKKSSLCWPWPGGSELGQTAPPSIKQDMPCPRKTIPSSLQRT